MRAWSLPEDGGEGPFPDEVAKKWYWDFRQIRASSLLVGRDCTRLERHSASYKADRPGWFQIQHYRKQCGSCRSCADLFLTEDHDTRLDSHGLRILVTRAASYSSRMRKSRLCLPREPVQPCQVFFYATEVYIHIIRYYNASRHESRYVPSQDSISHLNMDERKWMWMIWMMRFLGLSNHKVQLHRAQAFSI